MVSSKRELDHDSPRTVTSASQGRHRVMESSQEQRPSAARVAGIGVKNISHGMLGERHVVSTKRGPDYDGFSVAALGNQGHHHIVKEKYSQEKRPGAAQVGGIDVKNISQGTSSDQHVVSSQMGPGVGPSAVTWEQPRKSSHYEIQSRTSSRCILCGRYQRQRRK